HRLGLRRWLAGAELRRAVHKGMQRCGRRPVGFTSLILLAANEAVNQKMLCRALDVSPPGLAVILDRLQVRQLLVRERNEADRREHRVVLTEEGLALAREAEEVSHAIENDVLEMLTPGERLLLSELLDKMVYGASEMVEVRRAEALE